MTYTATVSMTGNIIAIGTSISGTIPQGQVILTESQFQSIAQNPVGWKWENGAPVPPVPVSNLQQLANQQTAQVTAAYNAAQTQPLTFTNKQGVTSTYPNNTATRHLIMETLLAFEPGGPEIFPWADVNGNMVEMAYQDLQGLLSTGGQRNLANLNKYLKLINNIQSATSTAGITSQVW